MNIYDLLYILIFTVIMGKTMKVNRVDKNKVWYIYYTLF